VSQVFRRAGRINQGAIQQFLFQFGALNWYKETPALQTEVGISEGFARFSY
jgi:hypothetical protein